MRGLFLQPLTVFLLQIYCSYSAVELNCKKKKKQTGSESATHRRPATHYPHKKFCLIFPSADRFCIFTRPMAQPAYQLWWWSWRIFNNSSKTKSNQFLRHPSYQGRKKENGELVLFYSSYYREKWEEGAIERAEHVENMAASIKHLITFRPKKITGKLSALENISMSKYNTPIQLTHKQS